MIVNLSTGGMQFFVPAEYPKLRIHEVCTFIFNLPPQTKCFVLGEIRYYRDFIDAGKQQVIHYGVKFIKLPVQTWNLIKCCCQNETEIPEEQGRHSPLQGPMKILDTTDETLITKTLALITAQIRLENGAILHVQVRDINFGGIRLQLLEPIPVNARLSVDVTFAKSPFTADGICNWCGYSDQKMTSFTINVSFQDIAQDQFENLKSLMMLLSSHMAGSISRFCDNLLKHSPDLSQATERLYKEETGESR